MSESTVIEVHAGMMRIDAIEALLNALHRISLGCLDWSSEYSKPYFSSTYTIRLSGKDREKAVTAIQEFTSVLGLKTIRK